MCSADQTAGPLALPGHASLRRQLSRSMGPRRQVLVTLAALLVLGGRSALLGRRRVFIIDRRFRAASACAALAPTCPRRLISAESTRARVGPLLRRRPAGLGQRHVHRRQRGTLRLGSRMEGRTCSHPPVRPLSRWQHQNRLSTRCRRKLIVITFDRIDLASTSRPGGSGKVEMANEREASVDRVITFSDGVVAIAITLLILPLTDIDPAEGASLADVAADNAGALLGFGLSFAVIANTGRSTRTSSGHCGATTRASSCSTCCGSPPSPFSHFLHRCSRMASTEAWHPVHQHFARHLGAHPSSGRLLCRHPELTEGQAAAENRQHVISLLHGWRTRCHTRHLAPSPS